MKNKKLLIVFVFVLGAFLFLSGCGRVACERICDWVDECAGGASSDCADECVDDYMDSKFDCRQAVRKFGRCVNNESCSTVASDCDNEADDFVNECDESSGFGSGIIPGPGSNIPDDEYDDESDGAYKDAIREAFSL